MLLSRMYKEYYPIKSWHELFQMPKCDRDILARWIMDFYVEIEIGIEGNTYKMRDMKCLLFLSKLDYENLKKKLELNQTLYDVEKEGILEIINTVLRKHKYKALSAFINPQCYIRFIKRK